MVDRLDDATSEWVARSCGSRLVSAERMDRWRPTWLIEVESSPAGPLLVLKTPRAPRQITDRSAMLSRFGIDREAAVLRALSGGPVTVPTFVAHHEQDRLLLIGRVGGNADLESRPAQERAAAMADYGTALARLHELDWEAAGLGTALDRDDNLDLPGPLAAVVEDRNTWPAPPDPLCELALTWLRGHRPPSLRRVLLHGDAGTNQFLVAQGRLTAVLDWELAHVGDPMSDLGYARYREALYPTGTYPVLLDAYQRASGRLIEREIVDWYTVAACLVMLIGIARDALRPRAANTEAVQRIWWDALSRVSLCQVLAEVHGRPTPIPYDTRPALAPAADLLLQRLRLRAPADLRLSRDHQYTVALAQAVSRSGFRARDPGPAEPDLESMTLDALAGMSALAPLAVSDSWGGTPSGDDAGWQRRFGRPVMPAVEPAREPVNEPVSGPSEGR